MIELQIDYGSMCAMTDRSAAPIRRQWCSTIPAIAEANIPRRISPAGAAFCRPMPLVVMAISMRRAVSRRLFLKPAAGPTAGATCELADVEAAAHKKAHGEKPNLVYPLAVQAAKRIVALFDIERARSTCRAK